MNRREELFRPEEVDERVDELAWGPRQQAGAPANAALVKDLYRVHEEEQEENAILETVRARLAKHVEGQAHSESEGDVVIQDTQLVISRLPLKREVPARRPFTRFATLVASLLFVIVLVGSMLAIFTLAPAHQPANLSSRSIYVGGAGIIYRADAQTGKIQWSYPLTILKLKDSESSQSVTHLIVADNNVYVLMDDPVHAKIQYPGPDHIVLALDAKTGKKRWSYEANNAEESGIRDLALVDGTLYATVINANSTKIYAFNPVNGTKREVYRIDKGSGSYITGENNILYIAAADGLRAINSTDGTQLWYVPSPDTNPDLVWSRPHVHNGVLSITLSNNEKGYVYAFNAKKGNFLWKSEQTHGLVMDLIVTNNAVYFGSQDRWFYAYDLQTGKQLWKHQVGSASEAPVWDGKTIYVPVSDDINSFYGIKALNATDGHEIWRAGTPGGPSQPVVANNMVYTLNSGIFVFNAKSGALLWKASVPSLPDGAPAIVEIIQVAP
ncbi:PQQ-binding-like beta-propeller repeat protein [Ktedonobacter racemifer]|uniref:Pyrrolo-quinoline quinone n=1 Tax=Ktedonobacter racemifer DSM 44963 TaxID=485913 RepID=D6U4E8_KTERA|nr:PQQ-binding-like beta-propeller repeat protein [Ktedonobacter racemifer]EFH81378.1 Pyrrolo-quinoline quinone [Ktedonobacter racemifer DSM 44963]